MKNKKCVVNVKVVVDREMLNQKLNRIQVLKTELEKELNSISEIFKVED